MIVDAVHITDSRVALAIAARMRLGQHGLLNPPPAVTVGGCFWSVAVIQSVSGSLIHQEIANPYSGRAPILPVRLHLQVDLADPETFDLVQLSEIHAEIVLGLAAPAPGIASVKSMCVYAGPTALMAAAAHRADAHLATLVPAVGRWIRTNAVYNQCPFDRAYFDLTAAQHRAVFGAQGLNATQGLLWGEVGRRIGIGAGTGWIALPAGCYLSRMGGGNFAVVRNVLVQHRVTIQDHPDDITRAAIHVTGSHSLAGDLG